MKLNERVRQGAMLLARFDREHPVTVDMYRCADDMLLLEAIAEAARSWRDDYMIPKYGNAEWQCEYVARLMDALAAAGEAGVQW